MAALRTAVMEARRVHAISQQEGVVSSATPFAFHSFNWRPKTANRLDTPLLSPETPIEELPLRKSVHEAFKALNIYCIEDLSAISEGELLAEVSIGRKTTNRLREILAGLGMEFSPNPDHRQRALDQSKAIQALSYEARAVALRDLKDSSPTASLGLRPATLIRALDLGHESVGALRRLRLVTICEAFGKRETREIYEALMLTDRPFAASAKPVELWRHGLADTDELVAPTAAHTPIEELRPWLGTSVDALQARGIYTLDALRRFAVDKAVTSRRRLGKVTAERVATFLVTHVSPEPYPRPAHFRAVSMRH
ncbi:hypothetical protein [Variovorax sp. Sphag1AA]|uniref:hypothetical protein n=1 Tax=Variovorax sp. Sphag1AA TaxID=2587027 RepID=UPI001617260F|nr:hypothetical protein [Variovorax sp. Sphag1AA]MBB3182250.1 hypothetical protein [Variovorax sp. Sphag1AA]